MILVQRVDVTDLAQHRLGQPHAVVEGGGLRQIQQGLLEIDILDVDVDAADQVGIVFLFRQPTRGG